MLVVHNLQSLFIFVMVNTVSSLQDVLHVWNFSKMIGKQLLLSSFDIIQPALPFIKKSFALRRVGTTRLKILLPLFMMFNIYLFLQSVIVVLYCLYAFV